MANTTAQYLTDGSTFTTRTLTKGVSNTSQTLEPTTRYYKLWGYYAAGVTSEVWIGTGPQFATPPSGHTLQNITILDQWYQ